MTGHAEGASVVLLSDTPADTRSARAKGRGLLPSPGEWREQAGSGWCGGVLGVYLSGWGVASWLP